MTFLGDRIVQYPKEYSVCLGCKSCELVCSLVHEGMTGPQLNRIFCELGTTRNLHHTIKSCQQCADHPCYEACPKKGSAMRVDSGTNIVYVVEEECIGCGKCQAACVFTPSRINLVRGRGKDRSLRKAKKCDLCRGREGGPACVEACPAQCIGLASRALPYDPESLPRVTEEAWS